MSLNREKYLAFVTLLEQLHSDATTTQVVAPELRRRVASLQQFFGQQIVPLADENWRVQSYQTEMSKQLRCFSKERGKHRLHKRDFKRLAIA
jgi:hypothetical protein